jgi:dTMP kinase
VGTDALPGPGRGAFIVVEGVEGAGKTTQTARLAEWLGTRGVRHRVVREPGGTPVGEAIRSVVLDRPDLDVPAETELLLILAARAAFVRHVVRPALQGGDTVLSDRYFHSTLAYQGYGRGLDLGIVRRLNDFAADGMIPDLVLILDVPVEVGRRRQVEAGKVLDRMEREGEAFLGRVRDGYLALAETEDNAHLIDATGSGDEVHARIVEAVETGLGGTFVPYEE